ncbi:hypothetical protein PLICRDRAFT_54718 [Plicaturopsis crispa FD-325 SS-3]|nr:hypothetical protein PLICRDRAFT_54718 [Plicaturopsis crispa FD-325 SS-3]
MSHTSPSGAHVPPPKGARTMIIGMVLTAGVFGAFFMNLHRRQHKKEAQDEIHPGKVPSWNYTVKKQAPSAMEEGDDSLIMRASDVASRIVPLPDVVRDQHERSMHATIKDYLASPGASDEGRRMHPTPQRGHYNGSEKVYTKRPDVLRKSE